MDSSLHMIFQDASEIEQKLSCGFGLHTLQFHALRHSVRILPFMIMLFLTFLTLISSSHATICIYDNQQVVLLEERFDDAALYERGWYDGGATNQSVVYNEERMSNVLEVVYPAGASTPVGGSLRHLFGETDTIYVNYHVKYSGNWSWTGVDYGPHELYLLTNADSNWTGPAYTHLTLYIEMVNGIPSISIQDGENIDTDHINEDLTGVTEHRAVAGCNGSSDGYHGNCYQSGGIWNNGKRWRPNMPTIENNKWYEVSVFIKLNSLVDGKGVADGTLWYWLNGELILSLDNILFRTGAQPNLKFNQILFGPYFHNGVPDTQKFWIDDLAIRTDVYDTTPPRPPLGLKIVNRRHPTDFRLTFDLATMVLYTGGAAQIPY